MERDAAKPVKLNLGCGHKLMEGFVNVDLSGNWSGIKPDVEADISKPLPFPDNHADEIHAYHVLEHFWRWTVPDILADWMRVLKPGGTLVLEMPCFDKILGYMIEKGTTGEPMDARLSLWGLYGDPCYESEEMTHKWCYCMAEITAVMEDAGCEMIMIEAPKTHIAMRDMRAVGKKVAS